ncbi:hypothetical protein D3C86_1713840 [compost metagenome]
MIFNFTIEQAGKIRPCLYIELRRNVEHEHQRHFYIAKLIPDGAIGKRNIIRNVCTFSDVVYFGLERPSFYKRHPYEEPVIKAGQHFHICCTPCMQIREINTSSQADLYPLSI